MITPMVHHQIASEFTKNINSIKDNFNKERIKVQRQMTQDYVKARDKIVSKQSKDNPAFNIEDDILDYVKAYVNQIKPILKKNWK